MASPERMLPAERTTADRKGVSAAKEERLINGDGEIQPSLRTPGVLLPCSNRS